ncbi:MAG: hypothetical protein H0W68_00725 [Gemmatimonadaceae bacterium]|nr:hypothetical protein [Gemmatimonadaceae bacterium]
MITAGKIFPYDVLSELPVKVTSIELIDAGGGTKSIPPNAIRNARLPLHVLGQDAPNWRELSVAIECDVPPADFAKVASDAGNVAFVVALRDGASRSRWSCIGNKVAGGSRWLATVTLPRASLRGAVEFVPYLVRTSAAAAAAPSKASHRGAIIGWSTPISVYVDEPTSLPIAGDVDVNWISFNDDPTLRPNRDRMFVVDVLGTRPVVNLNKDHEDLRRAMTNKSRQGPQAALRQSLYCYVVQETFMAITLDALHNARVATEDAGGVPTFPEIEWKADALSRVLRHLYRELEPDAALKKLLDVYSDQSQTAHLVAMLSFALQSTINVKKNLLKYLAGTQ